MARRYQHVYFQCPMYDGQNPPGKEIPSREEQLAMAQRLRDNGRYWDWPQHWRPLHCEFTIVNRETQQPAHTPPRTMPGEGTYMMFDAENKAYYEEQYVCTRHGTHPTIWARQDAWARRTQPIRDTKWKPERVQLPGRHAWDGMRTFHFYIPNRPDPVTLSNQWMTLAQPETRRRRRTAQ